MKKTKILSTLVITCAIIISTATVALAKDYGGWDELRGNYTIEFNQANSILSAAASTPQHDGCRETDDSTSTTRYRAHGWTTWTGVYHYTTARMEGDGNVVINTSGRVWDTDRDGTTDAISPWYSFNPDTYGVGYARTYYGT